MGVKTTMSGRAQPSPLNLAFPRYMRIGVSERKPAELRNEGSGDGLARWAMAAVGA